MEDGKRRSGIKAAGARREKQLLKGEGNWQEIKEKAQGGKTRKRKEAEI